MGLLGLIMRPAQLMPQLACSARHQHICLLCHCRQRAARRARSGKAAPLRSLGLGPLDLGPPFPGAGGQACAAPDQALLAALQGQALLAAFGQSAPLPGGGQAAALQSLGLGPSGLGLLVPGAGRGACGAGRARRRARGA